MGFRLRAFLGAHHASLGRNLVACLRRLSDALRFVSEAEWVVTTAASAATLADTKTVSLERFPGVVPKGWIGDGAPVLCVAFNLDAGVELPRAQLDIMREKLTSCPYALGAYVVVGVSVPRIHLFFRFGMDVVDVGASALSTEVAGVGQRTDRPLHASASGPVDSYCADRTRNLEYVRKQKVSTKWFIEDFIDKPDGFSMERAVAAVAALFQTPDAHRVCGDTVHVEPMRTSPAGGRTYELVTERPCVFNLDVLDVLNAEARAIGMEWDFSIGAGGRFSLSLAARLVDEVPSRG